MKLRGTRVILGVVIGLSWSTLGFGAEHMIRVALVLYEAPSGASFAVDPYALGTQVTEWAQMPAGSKVYLEAWVATSWGYGLTGVGLDVTYDEAIVSTFCDPDDPDYPANCRVVLGLWTSFASGCPIFYGVPDKVCQSTGIECETATDCMACVGGDHNGDPCVVGAHLCRDTARVCETDADCTACSGGWNDGQPCGIGAKLCSVSGNVCTTSTDCMLCTSGDNVGQGCTIDMMCSDTGVPCEIVDDCKKCIGGDNNGLACASDDDCPPDGTCSVSGETCEEESKVCSDTGKECSTVENCEQCVGGDNDALACSDTVCSDTGQWCTTADDCMKCVGGDNDALACVRDDDCPPDGTCEVSGESCQERTVCSDTGKACVSGDDCKKCVGGANNGLVCSDTLCSDTGEVCSVASDCKKCVGGDNDGLACATDDDCPPDGTCEVSGEACEESKICSDTGEACVTADDCMKCVGGDHDGVPCTIKGTVCSSNGEPCTTADDCRVCSSNSEPCTTADDCKKCVGGDNPGLACTIDDDCLPDGTCEVSGDTCDVSSDTCDDEDCRAGGTCEVSGETCNDEDCWPGGTCEVSGEVCHDWDCPGGGMCEVSSETCDDRDCPGGACEPSGETCDDEDCWPLGACVPSGETCDDNPEKDCVPIPGVVQNVGGNTLNYGIPPIGWWGRVATIEFDVIEMPTSAVGFLAGQDESDPDGKDPMFAYWGGGSAYSSDISFFSWAVPGGPADNDEDGVLDALDNCPSDYNPGQEDDDPLECVGGPNHHDPCETIEDCRVCDGGDNDGLACTIDNDCPGSNCIGGPNHEQPCDDPNGLCSDTAEVCVTADDCKKCVGGDNNGLACATDDDCPPDGTCDVSGETCAYEDCPDGFCRPATCAVGAVCDTDGVGNVCDNCPDVHNPDQIDTDECVGGLYHGDPCDDDIDCQGGYCTGDGKGDACDNCPDVYNPSQEDTDECVEGPHAGLPCNYDVDCPDGTCQGDGVGDYCDNCPDNLNSDQRDCDRDGLGDACETDGDQDGDGVFDTCDNCPTVFNPPHEVPFDCNGDGDTLDPGEGVGEQCDSDGDGIGDECECPPTDPPQAESPAFDKVRYISMVPGNPGRLTALRVHLKTLPPPFGGFNGTKCWVGQPQQVSENAGKIAHEPGWPDFMSANLQGSPHCMDWSTVGTLHVTDDDIVPAAQPPGGVFIPAIYEVQAIGCECEYDNEANYSAPFTMTTSIWGDLVGTCAVIPCSPPEGVVNMATDVTACLDKFRNLEGAVLKSRADIEPNLPDGLVNIADVTYVLDAFRGFPYPFEGPNSGRCPANPRATYQP